METTIRNITELQREAIRFIESVSPKSDTATLVTLSGELGAGKTAFTKEVAKTLGIDGVVNSPTFVLEKVYALPTGKKFKKLIHIDAYRLEGGKELSPLGFDEAMRDPHSLILLEWPERVADALPRADVSLSIVLRGDGSRTFSYA